MNFVFLLGGIFLAFYLGMIVALGFRLESGNFEKKKKCFGRETKENMPRHAAPGLQKEKTKESK